MTHQAGHHKGAEQHALGGEREVHPRHSEHQIGLRDVLPHGHRPDPEAFRGGLDTASATLRRDFGTPTIDDPRREHRPGGLSRGSELRSGEQQRGAAGDHQRNLSSTLDRVEHVLKKDKTDFKNVFKELDEFRRKDGKHLTEDLKEINRDLHEKGLLKKDLTIIRDDRNGQQGWAVVSEDKANPEVFKGHRNPTKVSTSYPAPHESDQLKQAYAGMKFRRGHYNGSHQSVEGGGGAHGGFDKNAVGGHVPEGARKELIEKALQLAGVPVNEQTIAAVNKIVTRESGWNPNITNNWDSNAKAGHPSTGLMQTIPSTFKQYALKGYDQNINDPLSNLVAAIRYTQLDPKYKNKGGLLFVASRSGGY